MPAIRISTVRNIISRTPDGVRQEVTVELRLRPGGYGKRVWVHWCGEEGLWRQTPAEFRRVSPGEAEIWAAAIVQPLTAETSLPGNLLLAACREEVDGATHWDRAWGEALPVDADSGVTVWDPVDVRVVSCPVRLSDAQAALPVEVAVRREAEPEAVVIHWTDDGWKTSRRVRARFRRDYWNRLAGSNARNPNRYGWGVWAARLPVRRAYRLEFAVECRTRRGPVWDNLNGANYRLQRGTLKAMTLNLHTWQEEDQQRKFERVAQAIRERRVDIVCLQEVGEDWNDGAGDWATNAARIINDQLPEPYHLHTDWAHRGFDRYREGVAILSRHPFQEVDAGYVSDGQDPHDIHTRKVVMAQVRVPGMGAVNVFCAHLSWPSEGFYPQFERLLSWVESRAAPELAGTLVCGDFNIPAGGDAYRHIVDTGRWEDQYLKIANPGVFQRVFRDRRGDPMHLLEHDGRIDYLWLTTGARLRAIRAEELFTPECYGRVSDHTGYLVEFELR